MAKATELTFDVNIEISRDTVDRCLSILTMYLTDHPDVGITVYEHPTSEGIIRRVSLT